MEQSEKATHQLRELYEKQTQLLIEIQNVENRRKELDESAEREQIEEQFSEDERISWWKRLFVK